MLGINAESNILGDVHNDHVMVTQSAAPHPNGQIVVLSASLDLGGCLCQEKFAIDIWIQMSDWGLKNWIQMSDWGLKDCVQ